MEKWEHELKKNVNRIMPNEIENRISHTLHRLPRKKRKTKVYYSLTAAILAVCMLIGATFVSPAFAETVRSIPIIGSVFEKVGNIGEQKASQKGFTTPLGQQVEINGQTIIFTESLYTGSSIHIGFIIPDYDSQGSKSPDSFLEKPLQYTIDGKPLHGYSGGQSGEMLGNGDFAGTIEIKADEDIPDSFTLGLSSLNGESWHAEIPVKLQGENEAYLVNETREWKDRTVVYDKVSFFPTSTEISLHIMDEKLSDYLIEDFQVYDDQGRVLQPFGGGGSGRKTENGQYLYKSEHSFEPLDIMPKSLTLKPYIGGDAETGTERKQWNGEGFELSRGEVGSIKIENVEHKKNHFTVTYEVEGELTNQRTRSLWMENQDGERFEEIQALSRVDSSVNKYQATFASKNANDDVIICTDKFQTIDYIEELEITINLNK